MSLIRDGISASPGIVIGRAHVLRWDVPRIERPTIAGEDVEREVERFDEARHWAKARIRDIQEDTAARLGPVESQIFEPQIVMLDDRDLIDGSLAYIRDNHLSAARAFELRTLEFQAEWRRTGHPMVMDRMNDLLDVQLRMLHRLLGLLDPALELRNVGDKVILVAKDLTPTLTVQLDHAHIVGIAMDGGTRTSHSAILARSLGMPAVVSLGDLANHVQTGQELILDGRAGRVIVDPSDREKGLYQERDVKVREWEQELVLLAHLEPITEDAQPVVLRANIDLPAELEAARSHGASGIGLFRTEFLVVGRSQMPQEDEQYRAYREVVEGFPGEAVYLRSYDLGGDKFPLFLHMPAEENPFLGWRAIRVSLDTPELFRTQLRAMLRASAHGDVRIMLPLVNDVEEVERTREILSEETEQLRAEGIDVRPDCPLGIMVETPAAVMNAHALAQHSDFFSIGTNDLIQYTLAVDRGNPRLAKLFTPFHPSVVRLLDRVASAGRDTGIEVSVCGELAANPLGVFLLLGLGIRSLSVSPSALSEIKKVIRAIPASEAGDVVAEALKQATTADVMAVLTHGISRRLDLSLFSGRWNLSPSG